jgi:PTH2 family peptidyl-tRNA hydrolase
MSNYPYKQVICIRGDLNYGTAGKMAAQVSHASVGVLLKYLSFYGMFQIDNTYWDQYEFKCPQQVSGWINGSFAKIVVKVPTLSDLQTLEKEAQAAGLPFCLITDNGTTVFNEPTITALAIGPWESDAIDKLTGGFKLA